ncbi:MAG: hypothetical protein RQ966_17060 [Acetobacteraceae bacterium]|nr:hypothetical protein [Acetobacteraceae bacterium]
MLLLKSNQYNVVVSVAALLLASASAAGAQTVTRFTTYLHSGPGLEFSVMDEIPPQTALDPECKAGWCRVKFGAAFGWVDQSALIKGPSTAQPKPGERPTDCMDFARTGWPNSGDLERVCIFTPNQKLEVGKPAS